MHELYIAQSILGTAARSLPDGISPSQVSEIHVRIGKLDAVVPESLHFLFDAVKANFGMVQASLNIEEVPVLCKCEECGVSFTVDWSLFLCPSCGSGRTEILEGRGLILTKIIANDAEGE